MTKRQRKANLTSEVEFLKYMAKHIHKDMRSSDIERLLVLDSSKLHWQALGGSGMRELIAIISENLVAGFQFNVADRLVSYGVAKMPEGANLASLAPIPMIRLENTGQRQ